MGQDISKSITPPPLSLTDCMVNGKIDIPQYKYYRRWLDDMDDNNVFINFNHNLNQNKIGSSKSNRKREQRHRAVKRNKLLVRNDDGSLRELRPKDTLWYALHVNKPPRNQQLDDQFRMRFRLPYESFVSLSKELTEHELFHKWSC